ncbi:MAG: carboxypeptidase regulatory-like domain-containing protein [Burkholderiaceae bacterium]|nr:carboxypeptidase regulatory-like domain-containing protein [Burkholderiaceae bacterium]
MITRQSLVPVAVVAMGLLVHFPAFAGTLSGSVVDPAGKGMEGAIVTLTDARGVGVSVYTNRDGSFRLSNSLKGELDLRVRKRYHRDDLRKIRLDAPATTLEVTLAPLTDPKEVSDDHPALSHFSRLAFDASAGDRFSRENFARDCLSCHQLGNAFTRSPRSVEGWVPSVQRMHGYLINTDAAMIHERAERMAKAFDGTPLTSRPEVPIDPLLQTATVYQWRLDGANVPHDAAVHRGSNKIYSVDMFAGYLIETDPKTGKTVMYQEPAQGMPPGGAFTKMKAPAPYGLTVPRAPHSLAEGKDGKLYLADSIGASMGVFDPKTKKFEHHEVGDGAVYPHTVRVDKAGIVWMTVAFSDHIARFDPKTKKMKAIKLPASKPLGMSCCAVTYGMDVDPVDGGIWYAKLYADKIGRLDPKTFEVREYDSPVVGPRRLRFDAKGAMWITGFSDGAIAKIDVRNWQAKIYKLPVFAAGEIPAPYGLAVHPKTQEVWINDTMSDVAWRFLPTEERFIAYPLPLKGTYTRDFDFTREGWACTSNNPIPPAALEGGIPEILCIDAGPPAKKS